MTELGTLTTISLQDTYPDLEDVGSLYPVEIPEDWGIEVVSPKEIAGFIALLIMVSPAIPFALAARGVVALVNWIRK
jgi:hypothetical protein